MSAATSFPNVDPPPLLFGQRSPSPPFSPRSPLHSQTPHSPPPVQMDEPEDVDMTSSTVMHAQHNERQDAAMDMGHLQTEQTRMAPTSQTEDLTDDMLESEDMDTTPDSTPTDNTVNEQSQTEIVSPASPSPPTDTNVILNGDPPPNTINTQLGEIVQGNGEIEPPAIPAPNTDPAVVIEERPPGSPAREGTPREDRDEDDSSEEDEHGQGWHEIVEDTSTPDEQELKEIEEVPEHSALEHDYWEQKTFDNKKINEPEYKAGATGRIEWTINYNGTKEKPNKELVMFSPRVTIGGLEWHIKFYPKGNDSDYLSVYVECVSLLSDAKREASNPKRRRKSKASESDEAVADPEPVSSAEPEVRPNQHTPLPLLDPTSLPKRKSIAAQVSVVLYNPEEPRTNFYRECTHRFCTGSPDWGWTRFHGPYYEIQHRHRGQRQPLLRNDTLTFTAYIRLVEDETDCLWEHPSRDNPWDSLSMTGLQGLANPSLGSGGANIVSAISAWMLLKPFREILYQVQPPNPITNPRTRPKPMVVALQKILYSLRTRPQGAGTGAVQVDDLVDAFDWYGMDRSMDKLDVIEVWEILRMKLEEELAGTHLENALVKLFGPRRNRATGIPTYKVPVRGQATISCAIASVTQASGSFVHPDSELPQVLAIELDRQEFDQKSRMWKKISEKLKLEDETKVLDQTYILYGFVTHKQDLQSGLYNTVLRPNGPGSKWYIYKDAKEDNQVVCLTQKKALDTNEGTDPSKPNDPVAAVAYVALYVRSDIANSRKVFDSASELQWAISDWVVEDVRKYREYVGIASRDIDMMEAIPSNLTNGDQEIKVEEDPQREVTQVDFTIISSKAFMEHEQSGIIDFFDPKWESSEHVFTVTLDSTDTPEQAREKIAAKVPGVKDPRQCKLWVVASLTGTSTILKPDLLSTGQLDITGSSMDSGVEWTTVEEAKTRLAERRLWLHVIDEADLPPLPLPKVSEPPRAATNGHLVAPPHPQFPADASPVLLEVPMESALAETDAVAPPLVEDTPMSDADEELPSTPLLTGNVISIQENIQEEAQDDTIVPGELSVPAPISTPIDDTLMGDLPQEPVQPVVLGIPSPPQVDLNGNIMPLMGAPPPFTNTPVRVEDVYFFVKLFDAESQKLKPLGSFLARKNSRIDHAIQKILGLPKDKTLLIFDEEEVATGHPLRRRKTFQEEDLHNGSILIAQRPVSDELKASLAARGAFADPQGYLRAMADARNFPDIVNGKFTLDYFGSEYYSGELLHRIPHGAGKKIYHSGDVYTGTFQVAQRHGQGTMIFSNGDEYTGLWENNQQHGHGVFVEKETGNKYEGNWKSGKKHGKGVTHWEVAQNEERVCRICWEEAAESAFYDCGHVVACLTCARRVESCPVCRRRVLGAVKLFFVS
ncbi:hypothetical protein BLS_004987 [Venturia inaequalis]|uniref:Uncharacterized protein n=1 Tax=Venturia inaequalis TaxID=5025 RepID=A0A8H3VC95_VENIN|nr:hypothetical protein BLS_004987 [Venturia inaequalis]KAE9984997.1 hypothetical protein EG328_007987 [Venturia inaequalis]KAE9985538.1 hypothetical protein EG327_004653 [Venturia inaequalis]